MPVLNEACELDAGTYIARLDADDTAFPDRLERQVAFLNERPGVVLVGGSMRLMNADGTHLRDSILPLKYSNILVELADYCYFFHSSVMFRRSAWRRLGGYRATLLHAEDYALWLRMAENYEVRNLPWFMGRFRTHSGQISRLQREQQVISAYVSHAAARVRQSGRPDPCGSVDLATRDLAIKLGTSESDINAAILKAHLRVAYSASRNFRAGEFATALHAAARYFLRYGGWSRRADTARPKPKM